MRKISTALTAALAMGLSAIAWSGDVPLNLGAAANRGFRDDVAGDGKGGWSDQGRKTISAVSTSPGAPSAACPSR